jgi:hypothetical protein
LVGFGWVWLGLVGFGWVWLGLVGFGWGWLGLVGFGWNPAVSITGIWYLVFGIFSKKHLNKV